MDQNDTRPANRSVEGTGNLSEGFALAVRGLKQRDVTLAPRKPECGDGNKTQHRGQQADAICDVISVRAL